jgi:hypothetical protein
MPDWAQPYGDVPRFGAVFVEVIPYSCMSEVYVYIGAKMLLLELNHVSLYMDALCSMRGREVRGRVYCSYEPPRVTMRVSFPSVS